MDPLAVTLGVLAVSSWLISYFISRPPLRTTSSNSTSADLPQWLINELESARERVATLLPFAVELVKTHELSRTGRANGSADPGPLPLATLARVLEKQLASLDTIHFKSLASESAVALSREAELAAALITYRDTAALDTLVAQVIMAHPLRLNPKQILTSQRAIVSAEMAVHTAAALNEGTDFDNVLLAHRAAAGAAPGTRSLALPVLSRSSPDIKDRAPLWIYIVGFAMFTEQDEGDDKYKGFSSEFNQIAEEQRDALRDLGLTVK